MIDEKLQKKFNVLSIIISKRCNGVCDYCLITRGREKDKFDKLPFYDIKDIVKIINSFELKEDEIPYSIAVQIVGGEPLLFVDYMIQIMNYMIKSCEKIRFIFNIYTNGCAMTPEILDKLSKFPVTITFSLDEVVKADTHRFYQGRPMNIVTMEKLIEAHNISPDMVRTNSVVSELTYKGLPELYHFHKENKIWKWGWGFMRADIPEHAEWQQENFQEMSVILEQIVQDSLRYPFILYNILEYGQIKRKAMTTENIPLYINMDETISTLSGDNCFRVPISDFTWEDYFSTLIEFPELYFLNDSNQEDNLTECIHCHYREKHLKGLMKLPHSQCKWSMLLRYFYNKYYKEKRNV